jgi:autotransporter translocation and assembly factor TamB
VKGWPRRLLIGGGVTLLLVLAVVVFAGPLVHAAAGAAGRSAGYAVGFDRIENHDGHLTVLRPDVASLAGEPIFSAARVDVAYNLGEVFGGPHLYGISSLEIDRPKITVIHHKDGTYNIPFPQNQPGGSGTPTIPQVHLVVKDGSVGILDDTRIFRHSRRLTVEDVQVDADLKPQGRSILTLGLAILEDGGKYPFQGRGTLDESRGYELTRIRAKTLALAPLLDYALNTPTLHFANGVLNDIDAKIYGLPGTGGAMQRHVSVTANLDHFQPYLGALVKPLRDGRGAIRVYDNGVTFPKVDGSIADVPVRISGAIYGLSAPVVRLGITGRGDLRKLITLSDAAKHFALSGPIAFRLLVEGSATQPMTIASFDSRKLVYAGIPLDDASGKVALHGTETAILHSGVGYAGMRAGASGDVLLAKHTGVELVATVAAPAQRVPYAAQLLGPMLVRGVAVVTGTDANLQTTGTIAGDTPAERLAGTFDVDGTGIGTIGPIALDGPGPRHVFARVALDRPRGGGGAAFVVAQALHVSTAGPQPSLPGISLGRVPAASGTVDLDGAGVLQGKHYAFGGRAHGYGITALGFPIDDVRATARVSDPMQLAVTARYRGTLAPLAAAAGGKIAASGSADIPISLIANGPNDVLVQIAGAQFTNASIAGTPLEAFDATIGVRGKAIDVYAARARLAGHDIVAQGSFGNGGTIGLSASGIDLRAFRAAGLPVRSGTLTAIATIGGTVAAPTVAAGIAAGDVTSEDARYAALNVSANTGLTYDAGTLSLQNALVRAGPAVGSLDGRVTGLRGNPMDAHYSFDARVRQADIGTLARIAHAPLAYPEGTLNADVRVAGSGRTPAVSGDIAIPEGSVNGLRFRDAGVALSGNASNMRASGGRVTVGTSVIGFDATASNVAQSFALHAGHIDLSDLNDYFDQGDTLGGRGSIDARVSNAPDRLATSGRVRLTHTRFHRFDIGDTRADWSTTGRRIDTDLALGSSAGSVTASGNLLLPATQPLRNTFARSSLSLDGRASGVDLATWLPAAGIVAPVVGSVDANATIHGTYPNVGLTAHAALNGGRVERVAIRNASLDLRADGGRATISNGVLAIDNASATASGSFGFQPRDPIDLRVDARTGDVGALAKTLSGRTVDASGSVTTNLRVTGTTLDPVLANTTDATAVRYAQFTIPKAHAQATLSRTRAALQTAEVDLAAGRLLANGSVPLQTKPTEGIADNAPLALNLTADHVDLGQFAALLPKGTQATGMLNGSVAVVGSRANPGLRGSLALTGGSFVGPQLKSKLTGGVAELVFSGRTVTLQNTQATIGGGTVSATGSVDVPDLRDPAQSASANLALVSRYAVIDAPAYLKGRINGNVNVVRAPGQPAMVGGDLTFSSTRIPTTVLLPSGGPSPAATTAPLPVAFNLTVHAGDDVRVQGGPVDIGAKGGVHVGGTLAAPALSGRLESTGGTLSLYRTFRLQYPSSVDFDPSDGLIPNVDALATTSIDNPPTDVTMHVTGPATSLNVALSSDPSYSREQILGLLVNAQALGAVSGVQTANGGAHQNPFQAAAEGQLGSLLTQNLLEPFSSQLGSAVGLNNLAINYTPGSGVDVGAQKRLIKNVNAVFAESFNYPPRESLGLRATPNNTTALQLTFFSQPSSNRYDTFQGEQALQSNNSAVTDAEPANGTSGFALTLQRKFR